MNYSILMIFVLLIIVCYYNKEDFTEYVKNPFGYRSIGTSPIVMYYKPLYRKPYRYPYAFRSTYPIDYMSYYQM
mgnify:CR=1 FL=1